MRRFEHYDDPGDANSGVSATNWPAQTFTPSIKHAVGSVKIRLRGGGTPTYTVSIRATVAGKPSGEDLASCERQITDLDPSDYQWYEFALDESVVVERDTMYAIVIRQDAGSTQLEVNAGGGGTYAGGTRCWSTDSGDSWLVVAAQETLFEEWGDEVFDPGLQDVRLKAGPGVTLTRDDENNAVIISLVPGWVEHAGNNALMELLL